MIERESKANMDGVYTVISSFGRYLSYSAGGLIEHFDDNPEKKILIYVRGNNGYLFADSEFVSISAQGMVYRSPVLAVDIYVNKSNFAFYSCGDKKFFCASSDGLVSVSRDFVNEWEIFSLIPYDLENGERSAHVASIMSSIDIFIKNNKPFNVFLEEHGDEALIGIVANITRLEISEMCALSQSIVESEKWIFLMKNFFSDDIWACHVLPELALWLSNRDRPLSEREALVTAGKEFDFLGRYSIPAQGRGLRCASPVEAIVRAIRENTQARKDVCVLATGRNEGVYYLEWIAFHQAIGVDKFFIYSNDNIDDSDFLLHILEESGVINFFKSNSDDGVSIQWKVYAHALSVVPDILDYKWIILCDLDEFLVINRNMFHDIHEYLRFIERRKVENIAIPWCCVGASNQVFWRDAPLMERFSSPPFHERGLIKSIFQARFAGSAHSHFPIEIDHFHMTYQNSNGLTLSFDDSEPFSRAMDPHADFRMAVFYHYYFKSIEEFLWKSARNRGDYAKVSNMSSVTFDEAQGDFYWENFENKNDQVYAMFPRIELFKEDFLQKYAELLSCKNISSINHSIKKKFSGEILKFVERLSEEGVYDQLPRCYKAMIDMVEKINHGNF